ncbi:D-2-hydroxyglutarate dehydrogenase, mitochondrial-like [Artemia franciscana]|uniref:D-2-hydroxyglutarate dehydrogenase, mitochondrial n=1 Tax=Artemia franciscana TaxID=6661 RepID=A0AA88HBU7_ARTSF|nr:hypothetical protein QYM36_012968 [Artemia franciscana]
MRLLRIFNKKVKFSSIRYYSVVRQGFEYVNEDDVNYFKSVLGERNVITDEEELAIVNTDWLKTMKGSSGVLLQPSCPSEVSKVLSYCNSRRLAVVPQGGNTGLVGGSVPIFDEIVLSTKRLNKILSLDPVTGILSCESGCILEALDNKAAEYDLMMPLDLGAKGSCHIGGNVATNAGGIRLLRYGNLHGSILGLEAVLANGERLDMMTTNKKDNTGYDLKHLFVGSEGTLGIITKVAVQCAQRPNSFHVAFLGLESFENVLKTVQSAKQSLNEILSSCEFMDDESMECVTKNLGLRLPIQRHPFYMLLETSGSSSYHDEEKLNDFLEKSFNSGVILDGTLTGEPSKIKDMWALRERIAEGLLRDGYCYKYDVSVPLSKFYDLVTDMRERLGSSVVRCCGYGHLGDGNLHLNLTGEIFDPDVFALIEPYVYERVGDWKGSISAEHGLGYKKRNYIHLSKSQSAISLMQQLKSLLDPNGILNPYKVLPSFK